jgi:hypothetical protein
MNHTPGPWVWYCTGDGRFSLFTPDRGRLVVMDFVRQGMNSAQPRFAVWQGEDRERLGGLMKKAEDLGELHDHPDARLIAFAPTVLDALKKHVCVKAVAGDGMNKVDYYPVEEDDCELCKVIALVEKKPIQSPPK